MYEYGMSALVLDICKQYAQATGLNFPPCVQQEINAIAQWVNTHTVKDLKISQDGNVLTFTFDQDKEVTFTVELPEEYVLNVDDLSNLIKGSSTVVVDKSADGKTLEVRLDKSQEVQSIRLYSTAEPLTSDELAILKANKENYITLYGGTIYKLNSPYIRDGNTYVYSNTELQVSGETQVTNVVVNMTTGEWHTEFKTLQNQIIYITLSPDSATQGTLTVEQFERLQSDKGNCIILNNEIYRLADNQHTTGVISYVHTGWDSNIVNKSINITVSTRAWTMVKGEASGGGKLYRHKIQAFGTTSIEFAFISSKSSSYTYSELYDYIGVIKQYVVGNVDDGGSVYVVTYLSNSDDKIYAYFLNPYGTLTRNEVGNVSFSDTVTEV